MITTYEHNTTPAIPATALVVDLRNFTSNLTASRSDAAGRNLFCAFLAEFHALCLDSCRVAVPSVGQSKAPYLLWTTGDGIVVCFTDPEAHSRHGFLAALVMQSVLRKVCAEYNRTGVPRGVPKTSFGIGLESGHVWEVSAYLEGESGIKTYVGHCINVAARSQEVSKTLHRARTIIGSQTNQLLVEGLMQEDYSQLVKSTRERVDDARYLALEEKMNELNRALCLGFIHLHTLRGVDRPIALFRVSESTTRLGNPRFDALLVRLAAGAHDHLEKVREFVNLQVQTA
jgi:class 3 adenylate cyclase